MKRPLFVPPVETVPDIYDLLAQYADRVNTDLLDAARAEAARGGQARTDAETATTAAKAGVEEVTA